MYTTGTSTLPSSPRPMEVKRAYLIKENSGPGRALSVDGRGGERQRLVVKGGLQRTSSDSRIPTRILVPPGSSATLQPKVRRERLVSVPVSRTATRQRVYSSSSGRALTEPVLVSGSAPTLLRVHPGKVARKKEPTYYVMRNGGPPPTKSYQVNSIYF